MRFPRRAAAGHRPLLLALAATGLAACTGIQPVVTSVTPQTLGTVAMTTGQIDPAPACASPAPTPSAPPEVSAWWNGIDPGTRARNVATGFELWSNTNPGCRTVRTDAFRGQVVYGLGPVAALSTPNSPIASRITSATLRLTLKAGNVARSATGATCPAFTGGVGGVAMLRPGTTVLTGFQKLTPPTRLTDVPPNAVQLESFATEVNPLPVPGTRGRATLSTTGTGEVIVVLDIRDMLQGALNRGDATFGILTFSTVESAITTHGGQLDCKTLVEPGPLTVKSL